MSRKITSIVIATAVSLLGLFGSGCASIVHGGARNVTINSQPAGAHVVITNTRTGSAVHSGTTPMTVSLSPKGGYFRGQAYTVSFKLDGYQPAEVQIKPTMSAWYLGNVIFGGLIGLIVVDPLTGAMWNLSPDKIEQPLSAQQAQLIKQQDGFVVVLLSSLTESEKSHLVRIN